MKKSQFIFWFVILFLAIFILDAYLIIQKVSIDSSNNWNWGWIIASLQMIYFVLSFKTVGPEDKAALLFFGKPIQNVGSGLTFTPWLVCSLKKVSRLTIQIQIPGEPEEIDKSGDDKKGLLEGKTVLPIRATTASYDIVANDPRFKKDKALIPGDPLGERMTLEPTAIIRLKVKDPGFFFQTIGDIDQAKRQIRDTTEAVIRSEFAKRTPALIIAHRDKINQKLLEEIEVLIGERDLPGTVLAGQDPRRNEPWGIDVVSVQLIDTDINKKVNEALEGVTTAKIAAVATVTEAKAQKEAAIEAGKGASSATLALLAAKAKGQQKLADTAKTPEGRLALRLQTVSDMTTKAQYSIVGSDGLMGAVASAMETMKRIRSEDEATENKEEK